MAPRSIALTEDEDRIVDQLVRSGRFRDADEVVREGLRLVAEEEIDEDFGLSLDELRAAVAVGEEAMARETTESSRRSTTSSPTWTSWAIASPPAEPALEQQMAGSSHRAGEG